MDLNQIASAVKDASQRAEVRQAVDQLYEELGAEIERRRPVCVMSGRCCHFEEYGHRLFVTTMELATFAHQYLPIQRGDWDGKGCRFQVGKLCGVHAHRPMGCRLFFCDPTATLWQQEQYEKFHGQLKRLHEQFEVPYAYLEWRAALEVLF
jgi:hypothetical protein